MAMHQAVQHFSVYLLGSKTRIYTDHKALTFLRTMKNSLPKSGKTVGRAAAV